MTGRRLLLRLLAAVVLAALVWASRSGPWARVGPAGTGPVAATAPAPAPEAPVANGVTHPDIGFRDAGHLAEHYHKHGAEFGTISQAEYLRQAQALRDRPAGGPVLESVRADGVVTRFDRSSGTFLAFDRDLTIRTFFRPNDGERYFRRQLARGRSS
jgi:hypothetical protein